MFVLIYFFSSFTIKNLSCHCQPRTQAVTFARPLLRKDPGVLSSRGSTKISCPRGIRKGVKLQFLKALFKILNY